MGHGLLQGPLLEAPLWKLNFNAFQKDLFYLRFWFWKMEDVYFYHQQSLPWAGSIHPSSWDSSSVVTSVSFTKITAGLSSPKPQLPRCVTPQGLTKPSGLHADANGGLQLLRAPWVNLCPTAVPLRPTKILLLMFYAPFGKPLSVSLTATIPPPLLCYH